MELIIEIIKVVGTVVVAFITSQLVTQKALREAVGEHDIKIEVLWDIYVKDAIKEARKLQFVKENSPISITPEFREIVPSVLEEKIREFVEDRKEKRRADTLDILLGQVAKEFLEELYLLSIENDVPIKAVLGAISVMIGEEKK